MKEVMLSNQTEEFEIEDNKGNKVIISNNGIETGSEVVLMDIRVEGNREFGKLRCNPSLHPNNPGKYIPAKVIAIKGRELEKKFKLDTLGRDYYPHHQVYRIVKKI